ncbi:MAG: HPr family phosphocarrier protein [Ruminococcaceae bacterium]|nr:HPr family phosphocarrier protein [Oscillospiraceae bacterium]
MKSFEFVIRDAVGIHARPAGMLVNLAKTCGSAVTIEKDGKSANAARLFAVMGLGIVCGDKIRVTAEGGDETAAIDALRKFFEENL